MLVSSYGCRRDGCGQRVMLSSDGGRSWETDYILRDDGPTATSAIRPRSSCRTVLCSPSTISSRFQGRNARCSRRAGACPEHETGVNMNKK